MWEPLRLDTWNENNEQDNKRGPLYSSTTKKRQLGHWDLYMYGRSEAVFVAFHREEAHLVETITEEQLLKEILDIERAELLALLGRLK